MIWKHKIEDFAFELAVYEAETGKRPTHYRLPLTQWFEISQELAEAKTEDFILDHDSQLPGVVLPDHDYKGTLWGVHILVYDDVSSTH